LNRIAYAFGEVSRQRVDADEIEAGDEHGRARIDVDFDADFLFCHADDAGRSNHGIVVAACAIEAADTLEIFLEHVLVEELVFLSSEPLLELGIFGNRVAADFDGADGVLSERWRGSARDGQRCCHECDAPGCQPGPSLWGDPWHVKLGRSSCSGGSS
jgi:hypothetical protein